MASVYKKLGRCFGEVSQIGETVKENCDTELRIMVNDLFLFEKF